MAASSDIPTPILLIKKVAGVFLLIVGLVLTATGMGAGYTGLTIIGWILLAAGAAFLILKIMRRNPD